MTDRIRAFVARGSARSLAKAIEDHAAARRTVSALVVPWESDATVVRLAVTSVKADGWAIEHTNLGTIELTELGDGRTNVAVFAGALDHPDASKLADVFARFGDEVERVLGAVESASL